MKTLTSKPSRLCLVAALIFASTAMTSCLHPRYLIRHHRNLAHHTIRHLTPVVHVHPRSKVVVHHRGHRGHHRGHQQGHKHRSHGHKHR